MVLTNNHGPITGVFKDELEHLRRDHVPRYLFRAWSSRCGGGPDISVNSLKEIVPPAFVRSEGHKFYDMDESYIKIMTEAHYHGRSSPITEFSSWSHSLALVIGLYKDQRNTYVAVMDTQQLDDDVKIWHCPHLGRKFNNYEFLAHGPIRGRGYKAVSLEKLLQTGLATLCPGLERYEWQWPSGKRKVFAITKEHLEIVGNIASLFEYLSVPVAAALLTILPRIDMTTREELDAILHVLSYPVLPEELVSERWLMEPGMIDTAGRPDVERYIQLLRSLVVYTTEAKNFANTSKPLFDTFYCSICGT